MGGFEKILVQECKSDDGRDRDREVEGDEKRMASYFEEMRWKECRGEMEEKGWERKWCSSAMEPREIKHIFRIFQLAGCLHSIQSKHLKREKLLTQFSSMGHLFDSAFLIDIWLRSGLPIDAKSIKSLVSVSWRSSVETQLAIVCRCGAASRCPDPVSKT